MDILELFPFLRRVPEPETPADTLPAITERLNGSSGDPVQVSHAIEQLLSARSSWRAYKQSFEQHLQKLVADGADEKKRRPARDAIAKASEEIGLLEIGEAPLRQRLVKANADLIHAHKHRAEETLAAELKPIIEALLPLMDRAIPIVARVNRGEINIDPRFIQSVLPGLVRLTGFFVENRSHFENALRVIAREPPLRPPQHPDSNPSGRPRFAPRPEPPRSDLQHAVIASANPMQVLPLAAPAKSGPRKPDDMSPLEPGEMRVRVIRAGYEARDGTQCRVGDIVKLPLHIAQKAIENSAVVAIEMNVDRTDVKGADWQGTDPTRVNVTFLGSGGTAVTQVPDKPPSAPANQTNEGAK